ncbi:haloacid dehalogenase type II [Variovorax ginsengisoli]|uniref:(S)-2-haloacid dehalogenase n=1 Tax=Variovorax ginsengisoli TaxID=363844 RepID=A0ABT8S7D3_9BURK|nr:haloacid dehalogenase type II [Variovorax ginsengisoli]MDN8615555.1 haloacid dehalogenase type II [Variovorax ginsengisoli]MDO1534725.1 haloacid dehalogenase type II [Variovorax ginsengisoli]
MAEVLEGSELKVIAFDVFGTVVDWHSGIAAEAERLLPGIDGGAFALAWRAGYQPAMKGVMERLAAGEGGFTLLDELHMGILGDVLRDFGVADLDADTKRELNRAWHRLPAWPDAVEGLARLKRRYTICTLSNGNIGLLTEMAKRAGLPWDCVLSAEVFKAYKPDPRTYLGVAAVFDVTPGQVMLAAAHHDDLAAARACGLRTGYIERPLEFGPGRPKDVSPQPDNTLHARDIGALADLLGC